MYNILISTAVAAAVFVLVLLIGFSPWAAIIPAVLAMMIANLLLARRVGKKVQELATSAQREIQAQRLDKGIKLLEEGFKYEKWQFLIGPELHSNIGILLYVKKDFAQARPHLEKAGPRGPAGARAKAMLGCLHYQSKDEKAMSAAFEQAVKAGKKEGIIWATYAWCLDKLGKRDAALKVLARAVQANPSDEKLKSNMVALQNEKRLKMRAYSPEWYQFHLEKPPMDLGPGGGRRVVFQRR
jgi:tetratricopeptide (TPR) repeat protein